MVISFAVDNARNQLQTGGVVYTFRWKRRAFFKNEKGTIEQTWYNEQRNRHSLGNVTIEEVCYISPTSNDMLEYLPLSGFDDQAEWYEAIMGNISPHRYPLYKMGWLYRVSLRGDST